MIEYSWIITCIKNISIAHWNWSPHLSLLFRNIYICYITTFLIIRYCISPFGCLYIVVACLLHSWDREYQYWSKEYLFSLFVFHKLIILLCYTSIPYPKNFHLHPCHSGWIWFIYIKFWCVKKHHINKL